MVFDYDDDYERFLAQRDEALEYDRVVLYAYCLLPNHFHLFEDKGVYGDIAWATGKKLALQTVSALVSETFGLETSELASRRCAARQAKKVALELCCRYSGLSQRTVGEYFGYRGNGSVYKQRQRLSALLKEDRGLQQLLKRLEEVLEGS